MNFQFGLLMAQDEGTVQNSIHAWLIGAGYQLGARLGLWTWGLDACPQAPQASLKQGSWFPKVSVSRKQSELS